MNIVKAITSEKGFRPLFKDLSTWASWLTFGKSLFGLRLKKKERGLYRKCTDRVSDPEQAFKEVVAIVGRRGGKSFFVSIIATFLGLFFDYTAYLAPGERGSIVIVAADRGQSRTIFNYISGALHSSEAFEGFIEKETQERIKLTTRIDIEIMTASHRTIRGRTVVAAILDEAAFFFAEGARPDIEIYRALKPSMATIPNALLLIISSPYSQTGLVYDLHKRFWGVDDPEVLIWVADTPTMNPTLDKKIIDRAMEDDPEAAESEWYAQFRKDLSTFLSIDVIDGCIMRNRFELPFIPNTHYAAFCDPAGGGGQDAMTLGVAHKHGDTLILDCLRAVSPPFDPFNVVEEFSKTLREYHCRTVMGDRYSGEWCSSAFAKQGIRYQPSHMTKSEIYLAAEPLFSRGQLELLDNRKLFNELKNLERRTRRAGKDVVDHPLRGSDDLANAACGAFVLASESQVGAVKTFDWLDYLPQEVGHA